MSELTISVGPQHPGSGHFRLIVKLDGDKIVEVIPDPGYVHRGEEKIAEYRNYIQNIPHFERPAIHDSSNILFAYVQAVEDLMNLKIPERGQYIRVIMAELNRIIAHLYYFAIYGIFVGHSTMFMWPMGDREHFIDLAQMISGQRVGFAFLIPGGVRNDIPEGMMTRVNDACNYFEKRLTEYERIFMNNPIFEKRAKGIGKLSKEDAIKLGVVGPTLRASGVKADIRKDEPYAVYDKLDFDIPVSKDCDSWARAWVHIEEMRQSMSIIKQALKDMPSGPVKLNLRGQIRAPPGEAFSRAEASRGAVSFYLVSNGGMNPYRIRLITPSFRNLIAIPHILKGLLLADIPPAFWSLDYWPVEADR
ncbi:MAG: NADH-quinone oxidoreductase subunit D [Candidatus Poseidoniia archaeon]|nr:NADH-quinone oxidoreductase subunit D [Candidatus Poseidoniia archaeon]